MHEQQRKLDFIKEPTLESIKPITCLLKGWWGTGEKPDEATAARVVFIFKGKPGMSRDNLADYRPISPHNTFYNIFAAIVQQRLSQTIDHVPKHTLWV